MQSEREHLVQMINQIAQNNISAGDEHAVADMVANHINKFWSRRMKVMLSEQIASGNADLHPAARLAATQLSAD